MTSRKLVMFGPLPIRIMAGIAFIVAGLPKLANIAVNQGFFGSLGLPPELVLPIALLEVIGGIFLIVGVLTRITAAIFIIEMIGATLVVWLSQGFVGGPLLKQAAILTSSTLMAICTSLLLIGPGRISIEWDILKQEVFPREKYITQDQKYILVTIFQRMSICCLSRQRYVCINMKRYQGQHLMPLLRLPHTSGIMR